jgi:putative restriction endonuclease
MKIWVGVTDGDWFEFLRERLPDEVNFWQPSGSSRRFRVLEPGEPFLFKLHSPRNFIVGGGFFVRHTVLPCSLAWSAFGEKNGVPDLGEFRSRIAKYRRADRLEADPSVGWRSSGYRSRLIGLPTSFRAKVTTTVKRSAQLFGRMCSPAFGSKCGRSQ